MSQFLASVDQSTGTSASASVLPMNIQGWFPLGWTGLISLKSKGLSKVFSGTTIQKHQETLFFLVLVLEGIIGLHRTGQLQLLQHQWLGYRLGLLWYLMVCLGNKPRSFYCFWGYTQVLPFRFFCWLWGILLSSRGFLPLYIYKDHLIHGYIYI